MAASIQTTWIENGHYIKCEMLHVIIYVAMCIRKYRKQLPTSSDLYWQNEGDIGKEVRIA